MQVIAKGGDKSEAQSLMGAARKIEGATVFLPTSVRTNEIIHKVQIMCMCTYKNLHTNILIKSSLSMNDSMIVLNVQQSILTYFNMYLRM